MSTKVLSLVLTLAAGALIAPAPAQGAAAPLCFGKVPTIVGTAGDDFLAGTSGSDVIHGLGGNDVISGNADPQNDLDQPDWLCGGPGADRIRGGTGPDRINGGDGNDDVDGWRGADVTQGNAGDDRVSDCEGENSTHNDVLRGGDGTDYLCSEWGRDTMYGEGGNDTLVDLACGAGPVTMYGGPGADIFESSIDSFDLYDCTTSRERDAVHGNGGADRATVSRHDVVMTVETVTRR